MPSAAALWELIRARHTIVPAFAEIPSNQALTNLSGSSSILPHRHYFAAIIDELFLANSRQWHREFDPMVVAITEFVYGGKLVTLPFIVGPKLLGNNATTVPQGMLYQRTRVAGVHPFRGGRVVFTVVLCQVRRRDYARQLLNFVETVATAVPFATDLGIYARFAGPLLDGVDALFGVGETTPLVGIRQEFDHDLGIPIRPAYFALIDGPEDRYSRDRLWVRDGRLMTGDRAEELQPLRDVSYVLFSTRGAVELSDLDRLPQHATVDEVINLAASPDEADWKRTKAELVVLLRQLLTSPDLTREQAISYHENIVEQAKEAHKRATTIRTLGGQPDSLVSDELRHATKLLDLP
jgi:hypothetical protein